jgi:hypothetical protein
MTMKMWFVYLAVIVALVGGMLAISQYNDQRAKEERFRVRSAQMELEIEEQKAINKADDKLLCTKMEGDLQKASDVCLK